MKITKEMLKKIGICSNQYELFCKMFPDGAEINRENVVKAQPVLDIWFILPYTPQEIKMEILKCSDFKLHYRDSYGDESWNEYGENGHLIHYRNSHGFEWYADGYGEKK